MEIGCGFCLKVPLYRLGPQRIVREDGQFSSKHSVELARVVCVPLKCAHVLRSLMILDNLET